MHVLNTACNGTCTKDMTYLHPAMKQKPDKVHVLNTAISGTCTRDIFFLHPAVEQVPDTCP